MSNTIGDNGSKRRDRHDIMAEILTTAKDGKIKTHIMYKCNLSFKQLHVYLDYLIERKLLESVPAKTGEKSNSTMYETTGKGRAFIRAYHSMRVILSG